MLKSIRLQDFKGHRDSLVPLDRLTVLVGPNGSGKTSVMEAIWLLSRLGEEAVNRVLVKNWSPEEFKRRGATGEVKLIVSCLNDDIETPLSLIVWTHNESVGFVDGLHQWNAGIYDDSLLPLGAPVYHIIGRARFYKLNASSIARPVNSGTHITEIDIDGYNTVSLLTALKLADDDAYGRIEEDMRQIVPGVKRVRIRQIADPRPEEPKGMSNQIMIDFTGALKVPAHHVSEGTLVALTLLTIVHNPKRPNIILLDDFDQSLHPTAQMELVRILKKLLEEFKDLQIIATAHSPYILDELSASQIQCFALREDGTVATKPLSEHPEAQRTKGSLMAGQLWSLDPEESWVLKD